MPVPIPGLEVWSNGQKVKFLTICGRPKTPFFEEISGVPRRAPLPTTQLGEEPSLKVDLWSSQFQGTPGVILVQFLMLSRELPLPGVNSLPKSSESLFCVVGS